MKAVSDSSVMGTRSSLLPRWFAERSAGARVYDLPWWYVGALCTLVVTVFGLIGLGGSVRIMKAGLACPDWPLCFGDVIPDYHPQVYFEFIHRVVAGVVGVVATVMMWFLVARSSAPRSLKLLGVGAFTLLIAQVVMGGLTVLLQLHSLVVVGHLLLGTGFFLSLLWIYLSLRVEQGRNIAPPAKLMNTPEDVTWASWTRPACLFIFLAIYGQVFLGGMVASHFASLVCTDFPTCHGQWFPTFSGIIGLHVIHRLGAYFVFLMSLVAWWKLRRAGSERLTKLSSIMFGLVCVQVCVGIANVLFYTPPLIAVTHLAVGTAVLSVALRQVHLVFVGAQPR